MATYNSSSRRFTAYSDPQEQAIHSCDAYTYNRQNTDTHKIKLYKKENDDIFEKVKFLPNMYAYLILRQGFI